MSNLIPITSIDELVRLMNEKQSVLLCIGVHRKRRSANSICHMTIVTVLKFIENKQIFY